MDRRCDRRGWPGVPRHLLLPRPILSYACQSAVPVFNTPSVCSLVGLQTGSLFGLLRQNREATCLSTKPQASRSRARCTTPPPSPPPPVATVYVTLPQLRIERPGLSHSMRGPATMYRAVSAKTLHPKLLAIPAVRKPTASALECHGSSLSPSRICRLLSVASSSNVTAPRCRRPSERRPGSRGGGGGGGKPQS